MQQDPSAKQNKECEIASSKNADANESSTRSTNNNNNKIVKPPAVSKPKISPYRKDARKLFVGGLGNRGTSKELAIHFTFFRHMFHHK
jgi:hypothetical protein